MYHEYESYVQKIPFMKKNVEKFFLRVEKKEQRKKQ